MAEGNKLIKLRVDADEDTFNSADSESEGEFSEHEQNYSSDKFSSEEENYDDESSDYSEEDPFEPSTSTSGRPTTSAQPGENRDASANKLRELDEEMKLRLQEFQQLMSEQGLLQSVSVLEDCIKNDQPSRRVAKRKGGRFSNGNVNQNASNRSPRFAPQITHSVETVYKNAIEKRTSSSSEDAMELSDESINNFTSALNFADTTPRGGKSPRGSMERSMQRLSEKERTPTPEEKAMDQIRKVEAAKAKMFLPKGEIAPVDVAFNFIAKVDQEYEVVTSHVDEQLQAKIARGEYIDFGKLIPKDRILAAEEETKMELVIKNGKTFWTPVSDVTSINCFNWWEQAFHIFANVYTKAHPQEII